MKAMSKWLLMSGFVMASLTINAQDAAIKLSFEDVDSTKVCKALVSAGDSVVKEVEVKVYVKRLFSLLPVGDGTTDEEGVVTVELPADIPQDMDGLLHVVARIEDDENLGSVEAKGDVKWGVPRKQADEMGRSLSGSRSNAPVYFIVVSNLIIAGIWGTIIYVVVQLFNIRRLSRHLRKANAQK